MKFKSIICLHTTIHNAANIASGEVTDELDFVNVQRITMKSSPNLRNLLNKVAVTQNDYNTTIKVYLEEGCAKREAEMMSLLTQEIRKQQQEILKNLVEAVRLMQFCAEHSVIEVI
ncbi:hypothetical protein LMH73_019665 [Vibrio splendidus]|nr:hypothetical protein [Vibrio splendidus]MCC4882468.1 hypothetical protein [Vibrio splendidus]